MPLETPVVELRNASFGHSGRAVVHDVDLAVRPGQCIGVLGPNGAGKTTLFRGLAGLTAPITGAMLCRAERVGYVPQREHLDESFPLSVVEVVRMGCFARLGPSRRISAAESELVERSLARVGLLERARDPFVYLSGGQRRRALIARTLVVRPDLCLLDEPTTGVDPEAEQRIVAIAHELAAGGCAVLWVDHDPSVLRWFSDEVLWVSEGRVRFLPTGTLRNPAALVQLISGGDQERSAS